MLDHPRAMSRSRLVSILAVSSLMLVAAALLFCSRAAEGPKEPASERGSPSEFVPDEPLTSRGLVKEPVPSGPSSEASAVPASAAPPPPPRPTQPEGAECREARDCIGARHPDCDLVRCEAGRCVHDRSSCECQEHADCDDGDPCTRDHCFVATAKCIFIPGQCDQPE